MAQFLGAGNVAADRLDGAHRIDSGLPTDGVFVVLLILVEEALMDRESHKFLTVG